MIRILHRFEARWFRFWSTQSPLLSRVGLALYFALEGAGPLEPRTSLHDGPLDTAAKALSILSVGHVTTVTAPYCLLVLDLTLAIALAGFAAARLTQLLAVVRGFLAIAPLVMLRDDLFADFPRTPNSHGWGILASVALCGLTLLLLARRRWRSLEASPGTAELLAETPQQSAARVRRWRRFGMVFAPLAIIVAAIWPFAWPHYLAWFHARQESAALSEKLGGTLLKKSMPPSAVLAGRKITTWVYLPPGYSSSVERYPVVYVMHGMPGGVRDCFVKGRVQDAAEELIHDHQIKPLILVGWDGEGPGGPGDVTNYLDRADYKMESFIVRELVPYIDRTYRTIPDAGHRALDGISAGGYAAPNLMFKYPGLWKTGSSHTGFFSPEDDAENMNDIMGLRRTHAPLWDANDPTKTVFKHGPQDGLHLYLDIGEGDDLLPEFGRFTGLLKQRGIDHESHVFPGRHTWEYWSLHFYDSLRYADRNFGEGPGLRVGP